MVYFHNGMKKFVWTKVDKMDKSGQNGHFGTKMDKMDKIGQNRTNLPIWVHLGTFGTLPLDKSNFLPIPLNINLQIKIGMLWQS